MHPVEHLFYFSCFALAFLVPYHPCHLLLNKYHTDLSALGTPHARTGGQNSCSETMIRWFVVLVGCSFLICGYCDCGSVVLWAGGHDGYGSPVRPHTHKLSTACRVFFSSLSRQAQACRDPPITSAPTAWFNFISFGLHECWLGLLI